MTIKLSIIIPLYNVEELIERAAKSIVSQTFSEDAAIYCERETTSKAQSKLRNPNRSGKMHFFPTRSIEVIVVDDGSTDSSLEVCLYNLEPLRTKGINIISISQANKGLSAARNAGIHAATGDYILFLDADDFLLPNALTNVIESLNAARCDVLFGRYLVWNPKKGFRPLKQYDYNPPYSSDKTNTTDYSLMDYILTKLPESSWNVWRYICKREFIITNDLFFEEGMLCEDVSWTINMLDKATAVHFMPEPFYAYYHRRPGSIMNSTTVKRITDLNTIILRFLHKFRHAPERSALYKTLANESFVYIYEYCLFAKADRKVLFDSYMLLLPMFSHSQSRIHRIAAMFKHPVMLFWLSVCMMCAVKLRRLIKERML